MSEKTDISSVAKSEWTLDILILLTGKGSRNAKDIPIKIDKKTGREKDTCVVLKAAFLAVCVVQGDVPLGVPLGVPVCKILAVRQPGHWTRTQTAVRRLQTGAGQRNIFINLIKIVIKNIFLTEPQ